MNRREVKRKAKDGFRKAMIHMPMPVKMFLTGRKIKQLTKPLLSIKDLNTCWDDPDRRMEVIKEQAARYPKHVEYIDGEINRMAADHNYSINSTKAAALRDAILFAYFAYVYMPNEYVYFHLDERDMRTYLSDTERKCCKHAMNDFSQSVFADKAKIYRYFGDWYKRDAVVIEKSIDYKEYEQFIKCHPTHVVKVVNSSRGKGVWLHTVSDDPRRDFCELLKNGKTILEEQIEQHDVMSQFNPSSINTIRISTYLIHDGVLPGHGIIRTGRAGSFTDNAGSGGIEALLDVKEGRIVSDAIDKYGNTYSVHPDSGIAFKGFSIPDYPELLDICEKASLLFPEMKYKSFDFAYSKNGWVIVEINPSGELGLQACMHTGMKERIGQIMNNMDLMYPYILR